MSDLETQLRALAARGELTYVSVVPVAGKNGAGVTFVAQVTPASRFGHCEGRDVDPVKALLKAIEGLPKSFSKPRTTVSERIMSGQPIQPDDGPGIPFPGPAADVPEAEPWDN